MNHFRLIILLLVFTSVLTIAQKTNSDITLEELKAHVEYLASDELEGRKPGTKGGLHAAKYILENIKTEKLKDLNQNFFQEFEVVVSLKHGENNKLSFGDKDYSFTKDFTTITFSASKNISAPLAFVGYGFSIDSDDITWNDYEEIDVKDKIVIILRGTPTNEEIKDKLEMQASLRSKVLNARDNGAIGVIFVSGEEFNNTDKLIKLSPNSRENNVGIPVIHVKRNVVNEIIKETELTIEAIEKNINENLSPAVFEITKLVSISAEIVKEKVKTNNVVAFLEGNDEKLKNEIIILGAHYDHLGYGGPGSGSRTPDSNAVHNGADDNASGTAAIMEVFEKLAANKSLKRSVLYSSFGAEEMGLLGSKHLTGNLPVKKEDIAFMINLDMVGRLDEETKNLTLGGTGTAKGLKELLEKKTTQHDMNIKFSPEGYGPSDHASFYAIDIPVLFFFTGIHEDYHTPRDDADKINYAGMKTISDFAYDLIVDLANSDERMEFTEAGPKSRPSGRKKFKVTLGIMPDVASSDIKGLRVDAVIEGKPAKLGGMIKGDIIVAMEGKPVNDIYDYMNRLSSFKVGQRISVEVLRKNEKVILVVDL